jgi:hypothetical protein
VFNFSNHGRSARYMEIVGLAVGLALLVGGTAYAIFYTGTVTSSVVVTSTTTSTSAPPPAAAILAIATASATAGGSCVVHSATSVTCAGSAIGQGGSYQISVMVTNTGNAAATVSAVATTSGSLSDASVGLTPGMTPGSEVVGAGVSVTWFFTYTAGHATGSDSVNIVVSA